MSTTDAAQAVVVVTASVHDNQIGNTLLDKVAAHNPSVIKAWVDAGFKDHVAIHGALLGIDVEVVRRNPDDVGFVPQAKRWVLEQTWGTLILHRRLARDYEATPASAELLGCARNWGTRATNAGHARLYPRRSSFREGKRMRSRHIATATTLIGVTLAISGCSSTSTTASPQAAPSSVAGSSSTVGAAAPIATSTSVPATTPASAASSAPRHDVPPTVFLKVGDLGSTAEGAWTTKGPDPVAADMSNFLDPDRCDPVPEAQQGPTTYNWQPGWSGARSQSWKAPHSTSTVTEIVMLYPDAATAGVDFQKHRSWTTSPRGCAQFRGTDEPVTAVVQQVALPGVANAVAVCVGTYGDGDPVLKPGEKCGYQAVILRGNTVTVLSWAFASPTKATFIKSVSTAAAKLAAAYGN
jgi:hypothetical protein